MTCPSPPLVAEPVVTDLDLEELAGSADAHPTRGCSNNCTRFC
jgi:hypothetical protein